MKVTAAVSSILLLSKNAYAGFEQITEMVKAVEAVMNTTEFDRDIGGGATGSAMMSPTLALIENYGCWCYFQENHGKGAGEAQNGVDGHCQSLHHGYTCVKIDAEFEGEKCDKPWESNYQVISLTAWMFGANTGGDLYADCQELNPDSECEARTCAVESLFTLNLLGDFLSGKPFDSTLKHDNGFDVAANCPRKIGSDNSPLECCGEYPPRFPYKTKDGQRGCCFDKTYDVELQECCMDYSLSLVCEDTGFPAGP